MVGHRFRGAARQGAGIVDAKSLEAVAGQRQTWTCRRTKRRKFEEHLRFIIENTGRDQRV